MSFVPRLAMCVATTAILAGFVVRLAPAAEPTNRPAEKRRDGNRLTYLDENNPWYPHRSFPKLITPQWVGEEGVESVVILAIDDIVFSNPERYGVYLFND